MVGMNVHDGQCALDYLCQQDFVDPLNGKQTIELFKRQDKTIKEVLPILKQYVK